jgi:hypothetical protein
MNSPAPDPLAAAVALLGGDRLAHVATVNPDGTPQVPVVWIETDGHTILLGHKHTGGRSPTWCGTRASNSMDSPDANAVGMPYHLLIHGHAWRPTATPT